MNRAALLLLLVGALTACSSGEPQGSLAEASGATAAAGETEASSAAGPDADRFGQPIDGNLPITSLDAIVADPSGYEGQVVRTRGEIARVCQARGCWMELRTNPESPGVRVPMAGHSFFLPMDSAGRHAEMQGRVVVRELSPEWRAHLESEGAVATASALSIEATGVAID